MKRTFSLFLAVVMAAALIYPAAAASSPWVQISGQGTDSQQISLQGLSQQYTDVQVTLNLNSDPGSIDFVSAGVDDAQAYTTYRIDGNSLTIYMTSKVILNQGNSLTLGTLTANGNFTVASVSDLKLLNVGANDTQTVIYNKVSMNGGAGSGSTGSISGSGSSSGSSSVAAYYPVSVTSGISGGSIQISVTHAQRGDTVTITALPDLGQQLEAISVTDSAGRKVAMSDLGDGKWSFAMPASAVTVSAAFVPDQSGPLPFADVAQSDWFWEYVDYAYRAGLMSGMIDSAGNTIFSPNTATTRGMVVTILYRYEGSPSAGVSSFQDVAPSQYYSSAVSWASANKVVNGYEDGLFRPDQMITREQMAAILYRYAQYKGIDVSGQANLASYSDADRISSYAAAPMAWANYAGLINGMEDHTLQPNGSATRAQVAAILMRFCENIAGQ